VHDKGIVSISSKTFYREHHARTLADFHSPTFFCSDDTSNQWICWDFHELRICPTHYVIQSSSSPVNDVHLKSWIIESSMNGIQWTEIDRRVDNEELNGPDCVKEFAVSESLDCRYIRLTQIGPNHHNNEVLLFVAFEIFGTLMEKQE
jgi:hypothetical protein